MKKMNTISKWKKKSTNFDLDHEPRFLTQDTIVSLRVNLYYERMNLYYERMDSSRIGFWYS